MNSNEKKSKSLNESSHSPKSDSPTSMNEENNLIKENVKPKGLKSNSSVYPQDVAVGQKLNATSKIKSLILNNKLIASFVAVLSTSAIVTAVVVPTVYATGD